MTLATNSPLGFGYARPWGRQAAQAPALNGMWHVDGAPFGGDIQAAIDAAEDAGGGIVQLGPSDYTITASLVLPSYVTLRGCGPGITRIIYDGTEALIECTYTAYHASNVTEQCGVERMTLSAVDASAGSIGIDFTQSQYGRISWVEIIQCETGVKLAGKAVCNSLNDVAVGQATTSFLITNGANGCDLYNCNANVPTGGTGVLISAGSDESTTATAIVGLAIDGTGTATLVDMAGSGSNIVRGVYIAGARLEGGTNGVRAASTLVDQVVVSSPYFSSVTNAVVDTAGVISVYGSTLGAKAALTDATTNASVDVLTLTHSTSGTPADGIGAGILLRSETDAPALTDVAGMRAVLDDNGASSEDSSLIFYTRTAGAALARVGSWIGPALVIGTKTATLAGRILRVDGDTAVDVTSSTAFGVYDSDGSNVVLLVNTTAGLVGIMKTPTLAELDINGDLVASGKGTFGGTEDASAILTLTSTAGGLLFPRMTEAQRDAIGTPTAGLVVYNTDTNKLNLRVAAAWEVITSA